MRFQSQKKSLILLLVVFASGCSTLNVLSTATSLINASSSKQVTIKEPSKVKLPTKNWNPPTEEVVVEETSASKQETKPSKTNFPWWILLIAITSGSLFIINSRKQQ